MTAGNASRRSWRWIVVGGLIVFATRDKSPPKHPDPGPGPRRPGAGGRVTDNLCGVSGSDQVRNHGETVEQHVARVTEKTIGGWRTALLESGDPQAARSRSGSGERQTCFGFLDVCGPGFGGEQRSRAAGC